MKTRKYNKKAEWFDNILVELLWILDIILGGNNDQNEHAPTIIYFNRKIMLLRITLSRINTFTNTLMCW